MEQTLFPAQESSGGEEGGRAKQAAHEDGPQAVQGALLSEVPEDFS